MKNCKKKDIQRRGAWKLVSFGVLMSILFTFQLSHTRERIAIQSEMAILRESADMLKREQTETRAMIGNLYEYTASQYEPVSELKEYRDVIFSHYSTDDGTDVGTVGASGLGPKDFTINQNGWYLYKGKVATANATRAMGTVRDGYKYWELGEEYTFEFEGALYDAIVADTGLAMLGWNDETEQRIDIWISSSASGFGLMPGKAYE